MSTYITNINFNKPLTLAESRRLIRLADSFNEITVIYNRDNEVTGIEGDIDGLGRFLQFVRTREN